MCAERRTGCRGRGGAHWRAHGHVVVGAQDGTTPWSPAGVYYSPAPGTPVAPAMPVIVASATTSTSATISFSDTGVSNGGVIFQYRVHVYVTTGDCPGELDGDLTALFNTSSATSVYSGISVVTGPTAGVPLTGFGSWFQGVVAVTDSGDGVVGMSRRVTLIVGRLAPSQRYAFSVFSRGYGGLWSGESARSAPVRLLGTTVVVSIDGPAAEQTFASLNPLAARAAADAACAVNVTTACGTVSGALRAYQLADQVFRLRAGTYHESRIVVFAPRQTLVGDGRGLVTLDCGGRACFKAMSEQASPSTPAGDGGAPWSGSIVLSALSGMTLRNGRCDGANPDCVGGALTIVNVPGGAAITDVAFVNCYSALGGGAVALDSSVLSLVRVYITSCSAGGSGGAVHATASRVTLNDCVIAGNSAGGAGGGVFAAARSVVRIIGSASVAAGAVPLVFRSGTALGEMRLPVPVRNGGRLSAIALAALWSPGASPGSIDEALDGAGSGATAVLANNSAAKGGAVALESSDCEVVNTLLAGNAASVQGGGVFVEKSAASFLNVTLKENVLVAVVGAGGVTGGNTGGGGVACIASDLILTASALVRNVAASSGSAGGGVLASFCNLVARGVVWASNSADSGGGLYASTSATVSMTGCLLSHNGASGVRGGGGVALVAVDSASLVASAIVGNTAVTSGGGILARDGGAGAKVIACLLAGNAALGGAGGGGGGAVFALNAPVDLSGSACTWNDAAAGHGGGGCGLWQGTPIAGFDGRNATGNAAGYGANIATTPFALVVGAARVTAVSQTGGSLFVGGPVVVEVVDWYNATVASFSDVVGAGTAGAGSGVSLLGASFSVAQRGVATFSSLGLQARPGGPYRIQFSAAAGMPGVAAAAAVSAAAPVDRMGWGASTLLLSFDVFLRDCVPGEYLTDGLACAACRATTYSSAMNATVCVDCPPHTTSGSGASGCTPCAVGSVQPVGSRTCTICPYGYFSRSPSDTACTACPVGAFCPRGAIVDVIEGFWRASPDLLQILACPGAADVCMGVPLAVAMRPVSLSDVPEGYVPVGATGFVAAARDVERCAEGNAGILCASCADGYGRGSNGLCSACPSAQGAMLQLFLAACCVILVVGGLVRSTIVSAASPRKLTSAILKMLLSHLQVLTLSLQFDLAWPQGVTEMLGVLNILASVDDRLLALNCGMSRTLPRLFQRAIVLVSVPVVAALCLSLGALIMFAWSRKVDGHTHYRAQKGLRTFVLVSVIVVLFVFHPSVTRAAFSVLRCRQVYDRWYLAAEMDTECYTPSHAMWVWGLALPALIVYSVGTPVLAATLIFRAHKARGLSSESVRSRFGFLYTGYTEARYYWESVVMARKVGVIAASVFLASAPPALAALGALFVVGAALAAHLVARPFDESCASLHRLESASLTTAFLTFYGGLALYVGGGGDAGAGVADTRTRTSATVLIVLVNVMCLAAFAFALALEAWKHPCVAAAGAWLRRHAGGAARLIGAADAGAVDGGKLELPDMGKCAAGMNPLHKSRLPRLGGNRLWAVAGRGRWFRRGDCAGGGGIRGGAPRATGRIFPRVHHPRAE